MSDQTPSQARESRVCAKCGVEDTHSHHVQYVAFNHPVTGEPTDLSVSKHTQCCAEDGCPICSIDMEHADKAQVGRDPSDAFTTYMQNKTDDHHRALFEKHGIETPNFSIPATQES